jgi:hypothetical protein
MATQLKKADLEQITHMMSRPVAAIFATVVDASAALDSARNFERLDRKHLDRVMARPGGARSDDLGEAARGYAETAAKLREARRAFAQILEVARAGEVIESTVVAHMERHGRLTPALARLVAEVFDPESA